jgi:hypothetical protein
MGLGVAVEARGQTGLTRRTAAPVFTDRPPS